MKPRSDYLPKAQVQVHSFKKLNLDFSLGAGHPPYLAYSYKNTVQIPREWKFGNHLILIKKHKPIFVINLMSTDFQAISYFLNLNRLDNRSNHFSIYYSFETQEIFLNLLPVHESV